MLSRRTVMLGALMLVVMSLYAQRVKLSGKSKSAGRIIFGGGTTPIPIVNLSASSLDFGAVAVGLTSASQTITLTNTGTASLTITSIMTTGNFSTASTTCAGTLAAGANCGVMVNFSPLSSGALTGATTFTDNAAGSPQAVTLTGTGGGSDNGAVLPTSCSSGTLAYPCAQPSFPSQSGYVVKTVCASGCDYTTVQAAVNAVHTDGGDTAGEIIKLASGVTFTQHVTLPVYTMTAGKWVFITTNTASNNLPAYGVEIDPTYSGVLAVINSPGTNLPAIQAVTGGANRVWIYGIEATVPEADFTDAVIRLGNSESSEANLASNIVIDRCYIHGNATHVTRRGIQADGKSVSMVNNWMVGFKDTSDSQCVNIFNSPGPYLYNNNHCEATGENILFGGTDPAITNEVPSDATITHNFFGKLAAWNPADPTYDGSHWTIKNHIEFKNVNRVLMEGNEFQKVWTGGQLGWSWMIFPNNASGTATWAVASNITGRYNSLQGVGGFFEFTGACQVSVGGCAGTTLPSSNLSIHDNLVQIAGGSLYDPGSNNGQFMEAANSNGTVAHDIYIGNNTVFQTRNIIFATDPTFKTANFTFENNIMPHNANGVIGTSSCCASTTLNAYFTNYLYTSNVMENIAASGMNCTNYAPGTNQCPVDWATVKFVNAATCTIGTGTVGDCDLQVTSPYYGTALGGGNYGADITTLLTKINGVQ